MAAHFYDRDEIRRNTLPDISGSIGIMGWPGVAASRDACRVGSAP